MKGLIGNFPREVGFPERQMCPDKKTFYHLINKYNKKKNLYWAVYQCDKDRKYDRSSINIIFFDFDSSKAFVDICKLHNYCSEQDIKHMMVFSGGGYHFYIFARTGERLQCNKTALLNAHNFFCNMLSLSIDPHVKGDVARISRVPNTWNRKRQKYCIPLALKDLKKGDEFIRDKAKEQNFSYKYYGKKLLNMKQFDNGKSGDNVINKLDADILKEIKEDDLLKELPLCIASMLKKGSPGWRERFFIILWFMNKGYLKNETIEILKVFLTPEKFRHCVIEEKQVDYLYSKYELLFPRCESIRAEGYCVKPNKICKAVRELYK